VNNNNKNETTKYRSRNIKRFKKAKPVFVPCSHHHDIFVKGLLSLLGPVLKPV
jgi:hypothetical protein